MLADVDDQIHGNEEKMHRVSQSHNKMQSETADSAPVSSPGELKLTIMWAPQCGTSAEGVNRRMRPCERHSYTRAVEGPTWGFGERELPSGVRGAATAASDFYVYTDKIWASFRPQMCKHTAAEIDKLGEIGETKPKTGQMVSWKKCNFFSGHVVKNRDCPGKSGTDCHLR